jgi:hypothetical protein
LVVAVASFICFGIIAGPVAIGLGYAGRRQVRSSNGLQTGDSLGLAGMIIGAITFVGYIALYAFLLSRRNSTLYP